MATAQDVVRANELRRIADELDPPKEQRKWRVAEGIFTGDLVIEHPKGHVYLYIKQIKYVDMKARAQVLVDAMNVAEISVDTEPEASV